MKTKETLLKDKLVQVSILLKEIRLLEDEILEDKWKGIEVCPFTFEQISEGKCSYGETIRGIIYCNHINCHK